MIRSSTLPSGLRVLSDAMPHVRSVTVGVWCDVGSAAEPPERRGLSHLLEHMVFKGTARRSARAIAEAIDAVGGELNAATDRETTCFYAHVVDRALPLAVDLLGDLLQGATLDGEDLRKEKQVVLEEIKMYDDAPDDVVAERFLRTLWRGSQLGEPTIGYAHTVEAIGREHLVRWRAERYTPQTTLVTAAGNLVHDDVVALVERAFAQFGGAATAPLPESPPFTGGVDVTIDDTEQAYVMLGTPGLALADERRYALSVLDVLLGGGMSSRLFQSVREERALAYEIASFQQSYRRAGLFGISAGCAPQRAQECVDVIGSVLDRLLDAGARDDEVRRAREHLKGNLVLALESTYNRMTRLARNELIHGRDIPPEEVESRFDGIDAEQVTALARELLAPAMRGLCVLGPPAVRGVRLSDPAAA